MVMLVLTDEEQADVVDALTKRYQDMRGHAEQLEKEPGLGEEGSAVRHVHGMLLEGAKRYEELATKIEDWP